MPRHLHKSWKDKRSGFRHRIRWYDGDTVRLRLETPEGEWNVYPEDKTHAQAVWIDFKTNHEKFKYGEDHSS